VAAKIVVHFALQLLGVPRSQPLSLRFGVQGAEALDELAPEMAAMMEELRGQG